jgi:TolB-like protein/DNA-binding SARP family transcriptional activator
MLRVRVFGECFVEQDGVRLDELSGQRKGLALLALLASAGEKGLSRDTVLGFFWPESDEDRARTSLRQLLHSLRSQLQCPSLFLASPRLRLNPAVIGSDVSDFRAAVDSGDLHAAASLYSGPFIDGLYISGADEFERWASSERASLAAEAASAIEALAKQESANGNGEAAVKGWQRLTKIDPLSARAAIGLMAALDAIGERAAALQHGRQYEERVRADFGTVDPGILRMAEDLRNRVQPIPGPPHDVRVVAPSNDEPTPHAAEPVSSSVRVDRSSTRQMLAAVIALFTMVAAVFIWRGRDNPSESGFASDARGTRLSSRTTIAVLPFVNTSAVPEDEALSDGLTEELIGALANVPGIRVTGRTSAFAFKGRAVTSDSVIRQLKVASVLEGSVRRVGNRIRVSAQLVGTDGSVLWADDYDRELSDILAVQDDIARAIVGALRVTVADVEATRFTRRGSIDPRSYEAYLRGRHILTTRLDQEGAIQAKRYFEQAVSHDSLFAPAYAGISDVHTRRAVFGFGRAQDEFALAVSAAQRAIAIDSTVAEAHAALGHAFCVGRFDWRSAENSFRRAVALNPSYTFARLPFAICLASQGRFAEAVSQIDTARQYDPLAATVSNVLGRLHVAMRQPDQAIRALDQALEINPQMDLAFQQLGYAYLQKKLPDKAIYAFRRAAELGGLRDSAHLAYGYAVTGRRADAHEIVRHLVRSSKDDRLAYHIAVAYAGLDDRDQAFAWLERGRVARSSFMIGVKVDPAFTALHGDRRWNALLRKMGF